MRVWLLLAGVAAIALAGAVVWRQQAIVARVQGALPARPEIEGQPAVFRDSLANAEARLKSARTALDGVAELGRLYQANGFNAEAEACWRLLRREQRGEARWSYHLADLLRVKSDYDGMTALLEETLRLAPDYAPARLQLANVQFKSGRFAEAEGHYRRRLEQLPQDPHARLGLVRLALQGGRTDEARTLLERLLADTPHFSSAHNLYAELLAAAGDAAGANRHRWLGRETLRYRDPEDPWLDELLAWCHDYARLCVLGTIESQGERHDRAQDFFERAIRLDPGRSHAYELLAGVYLKRNDAGGARDLLEQALPRLTGPRTPEIYTTLGAAYRALQQPAEAIRVARLGLEEVGAQSELLDALGLALADAGKHDGAIKAWQSALVGNPGAASINHQLARSFLALRRLDDALAALDRSLTLQPTFLPTLLLRGEIELQAGHLEDAGKYLLPAFESHPHEAQARRLLAAWHLRSGTAAEEKNDPALAERHYRDGLAVDENHAELLVRLGLFYLVQARPAEAIGPLASYHALQPESAPGCLFLGQAFAATGRREEAREILNKGAQLADRSGNTRAAEECRRLLQQL